MDTEEDARKGRVVSQAGESSICTSLQLELRVPDTQMLTIFRDAFLRWLMAQDRTVRGRDRVGRSALG